MCSPSPPHMVLVKKMVAHLKILPPPLTSWILHNFIPMFICLFLQKEVNLNDDDLLGDIMSELHQKPAPSLAPAVPKLKRKQLSKSVFYCILIVVALWYNHQGMILFVNISIDLLLAKSVCSVAEMPTHTDIFVFIWISTPNAAAWIIVPNHT